MAKLENEQIVETAIEARGAERGPYVRNVLVWIVPRVVAFVVIYFVFFDLTLAGSKGDIRHSDVRNRMAQQSHINTSRNICFTTLCAFRGSTSIF